eukprot:491673-Pyramimonas_sp.AAC.1
MVWSAWPPIFAASPGARVPRGSQGWGWPPIFAARPGAPGCPGARVPGRARGCPIALWPYSPIAP